MGKNVQKEWQALVETAQLTSAQGFQEVQIASDTPGAGVSQSCRLLRLIFSVNWSYTSSCVFVANPHLPFIWIGLYNTNTQSPVNLVQVVPTNIDSDKPWMFRRAWPIPVEPAASGGAGQVVPVQGGPWVGGEMWCDWPIHGGRGTSALEHDRSVRLVLGVGPATLLGASEVLVTVCGMMLCEQG